MASGSKAIGFPTAREPPSSGDRGGDLTRVDLLWGVDVSWKRGLVFNARIESALSGSGLWSEAVENGRCIVPVRAFYETRNVDGGTGGRKPQYRFASAGGTALLLAGLRLGDRFVLVTCEPDAVVGRVHSRMPLSLTAPEALAWLDRSTTARDLLARHAPRASGSPGRTRSHPSSLRLRPNVAVLIALGPGAHEVLDAVQRHGAENLGRLFHGNDLSRAHPLAVAFQGHVANKRAISSSLSDVIPSRQNSSSAKAR